MSSSSRYESVPYWYTPVRPVPSLGFRLVRWGRSFTNSFTNTTRIGFSTSRVNGTVVLGSLGLQDSGCSRKFRCGRTLLEHSHLAASGSIPFVPASVLFTVRGSDLGRDRERGELARFAKMRRTIELARRKQNRQQLVGAHGDGAQRYKK